LKLEESDSLHNSEKCLYSRWVTVRLKKGIILITYYKYTTLITTLIKINIFFTKKVHVYMCLAFKRLIWKLLILVRVVLSTQGVSCNLRLQYRGRQDIYDMYYNIFLYLIICIVMIIKSIIYIGNIKIIYGPFKGIDLFLDK